MIQIGGKTYELIQNYKDAWDAEAFKQRYSEVLDRYDYIIGDWGYEKLRLKGFLRDNHPKANRDTAYSGITDYINEYCNFGCKYFVLQKAKDSGTKEQSKEHAQESNKEHGKGHVRTHAKDQNKEQSKEQSKEQVR
ncbi:YutD family protein [Paenibacillus apis]|uniref:DUF1027 domain-containing protein n=1 Tax=Paenibacillus apis TaxID=1792174 RepID=A0A920CNW6_9BACL|nr:YutD family protein [Paenibacillus apis]GIO43948.1 hypothetical protein J41TS4_37060 [Paenibacillus apis]